MPLRPPAGRPSLVLILWSEAEIPVIFPIRRTAAAVFALSLAFAPVSFSGSALADGNVGAYLAGRQALIDSKFDEAATYYTRALAGDATNPVLLENLTLSLLALGAVDRALPVAQQMETLGQRSQIAHMVVMAGLIQDEDFQALLERDPEVNGVSPLVDGLIEAWALLGQGSVEQALQQFDQVRR